MAFHAEETKYSTVNTVIQLLLRRIHAGAAAELLLAIFRVTNILTGDILGKTGFFKLNYMRI
jgi:hypothetical protein